MSKRFISRLRQDFKDRTAAVIELLEGAPVGELPTDTLACLRLRDVENTAHHLRKAIERRERELED